MGFDVECIVNLQSLPGEYFCPVCRTLVYPNEALQSQCTHLYCKPCLTYIVGTTKSCPYDNYLVTEADSKPLVGTNKALAETIGKVLVYCLFHRSGCSWQGPLSECTSHCSGCAFGNSPVVCNRCGMHIVHRQVQEHAQTCSGLNPQGQQATEISKDAGTAGTASSANPSQTGSQQVAQISQAQVSQAAAALPAGQESNQQTNANPQVQGVVTPAAMQTAEQWYQQQYQQFHQQYPGYDPYQQAYQQYYPYHQQTTQPQVYAQPHTVVQPQHQLQVQPQVQGQTQPQAQPQMQLQPQPQPQTPAQGQPHSNLYVQNQVNPQQQLPVMQPHSQVQSQAQPSAHGHMAPQQQPYPLGQPHPMQPHPQQLLQEPQYPQGHQVQPQIQPQPHSQPHVQPQRPTYPPVQPQNPPQLHPAQPNQPQIQQPAPHAVPCQHSFPPVQQAHQQMQMLAPHHHNAMLMQPPGGFPPQNHQMRLPQPAHTLMPNQQQPSLMQTQGQPPSIPPQQHQIHPHSHQRPVVQSMQQPIQQFGQQPIPGQASGPLHHQVPYAQQPMQSQPRPHGPSPGALPPPPHGIPSHQPQTYVGRPVAAKHVTMITQQPFQQSHGALGVAAQPRSMHPGPVQQSGHQINPSRMSNQEQVSSEQQLTQSGNDASGARVNAMESEQGNNLRDEEHRTVREVENNSTEDEALDKNAGAELDGVKDGKKLVKEETINDNLESSSGVGSSELVTLDEKDGTSVVGHLSDISNGSTPGKKLGQGHQQLPMPYGPSSHQLSTGGPPLSQTGLGQGSTQLRPRGPEYFPPKSVYPPEHFQLPGNLSTMISSHSQAGAMGRAPPQGPDGPQHPLNPVDAEIFQNQRPRHFEGRYPERHMSGPFERGQFGQPSNNIANLPRMNGDERFKTFNEPPDPFPIGPARRFDQGGFEEAPNQFPKPSYIGKEPSPKFGRPYSSSRAMELPPREFNYDAGGGPPSRFLPPYHPPDGFHPNDAGERSQPNGFREVNRGRGDSARTQLDFIGSAPAFGRHQMDRPTPRSPGREYLGEGPRSFLHGQLRRGDFDGPGNFGMNDHFRNGDMMGQEFLPPPSHLRRGELAERGFLPGEPFGGNKSNHPRLGEPGFRSSYPLHGFPNDVGFYAGNPDPFDSQRNRMPPPMGWCRICKVDCESVEGLDLHGQTMEHQKLAMDMVVSIKQRNAKRQKTSKEHSFEEGSRSRKAGVRGRGKKT